MKITVLDGHALNPGDLTWDCFEKFGSVTVYPRTPKDLVVERIADSDAILLNKIQISSEILAKCPKLKYIGVLATGYNVIDCLAARKAGVTVTNIPAYSTFAVAQHVFALLFEFTNCVAEHSNAVHSGDWIKNPDFCFWKKPLMELEGKTFGIFGYGNIGKQVAKIAVALGMNVIVCTRTPDLSNSSVSFVSKEELLSKSDILSLHAPLTQETDKLINESTLSIAKKGLILINTARGGLVDEKAVRNALDSKKLAYYAADVLSVEPMLSDNPLLKAQNCVLTPHLAWAPLETRQRLLKIAVSNLERFIAGKAQNVVN